jgi:hypothetical protein
MIRFDMILKTCSILWYDLIQFYMSQTCLDLSKSKRWQNTQKFEWMTDKVADDDYYKVIPWIASSKSSDQKR